MKLGKILTCIMLLGLCTQLAAAPDGKQLYRDNCSVCHQTKGKGGIGLPLTEPILKQVSDDYLLKTIRVGRPGRIMPPFQHLSDAQVRAIVKYMRDWTGNSGPVFSSEPVKGDMNKGKQLFAERCASCHGKDGSGADDGTGVTLSRERAFGVMPPAITNAGFLQAAPDAMIKHIISKGRPSGKMPTFDKQLTDVQKNDVVAYIRSFEDQDKVVVSPPKDASAAWIVESPYDFETTVENVRQALTGANFRIFPARFLEQGLTDEFSHNQRQVAIRFCNFKELYHLLQVEPRLGTVLPCRINVLERKDGKVILVASDVANIAYLFNNDKLVELGKVMGEIIRDVMDEATL
jgi:cytochrome c oxidase cbb3-type subunit 3